MNTSAFPPLPAPSRHTIRTETRHLILEALEYNSVLTRREASALTGLSPATIRRAATQLEAEGILEAHTSYARSEQQARRMLTPASRTVLTVLDLSTPCMEARLIDGRLSLLASTSLRYNSTFSPEDNLYGLCRQVLLLAGGCAAGRGLLPVLLMADIPQFGVPTRACSPSACAAWVMQACGTSPVAIVRVGDAIAMALRYLPSAMYARSLLYLRIGKTPHAMLMERVDPASSHRSSYVVGHHAPAPHDSPSFPVGPWVKATTGADLSATLAQYLTSDEPMSHPPQGLTRFIRDFYAFATADAVVIEPAGRQYVAVEELRPYIPAEAVLYLHPNASHIPTLAQWGAARIGRRAMWDACYRGRLRRGLPTCPSRSDKA